jgi:hypothetical protein
VSWLAQSDDNLDRRSVDISVGKRRIGVAILFALLLGLIGAPPSQAVQYPGYPELAKSANQKFALKSLANGKYVHAHGPGVVV